MVYATTVRCPVVVYGKGRKARRDAAGAVTCAAKMSEAPMSL